MKAIQGYLLALAMLVAWPAAAQETGNEARPIQNGMMQGGMMGMHDMMQGMQHCMMMMQSMHGMMNGTSGSETGMMQGQGMGTMQGSGMMGMMGSGMMDVMQDARSMMLVQVLPTMREPLRLNDAQVTALTEARQELMESHAGLRDRIQSAAAQLGELMAQDDADPSEVERLMKEMAEARAEMHAQTFATAQEMKDLLSAEQRATLSEMQPTDVHRHMMQNMSMMDMMQMLNQIHGGPTTGGGGMMNQGAGTPHQQHHGGR